MRKTYGLSVLLIVLIAAILASDSRPLQAQSGLATTAATEDQSACIGQGRFHVGVTEIAVSPDGKYVVANWKTGARLWEVETGKVIYDFPVEPDLSYAVLGGVAFSPDGKYVLTALEYQLAILWDVATGKQVHRFEIDPDKWGEAKSATFSPNGKYILIGYYAGGRLWDAHTGVLVRDLRQDPFRGLYTDNAQFSNDSKRVLIDGGMVSLWDIETGQRLFKLDNQRGSLSPDGRYFITYAVGGDGGGGPPGDMQLWDAQRFVKLRTVTGDFGEFSPNGNYLWTFANREFALWEVASGTKLHAFLYGWLGYFFHNHNYLAVTEFPVGQDNMTFSVWDVITNSEMRSFTMDETLGSVLLISPDDRYLVVGNEDGGLRLRDIQTGKVIRKFC